jgi:hypothetical protein
MFGAVWITHSQVFVEIPTWAQGAISIISSDGLRHAWLEVTTNATRKTIGQARFAIKV